MDSGVKVVTLDRKVNTDVTMHIGADNKLIGRTAGEFVCKTLNGKGSVVEIQGTAGVFGDDRPQCRVPQDTRGEVPRR